MFSKFLNHPFHILDKKSNRWKLIIFVGIFAMLFMNLYNPFNISHWYEKRELPLFIILSSFGLVGMIVLTITQLYIRDLFKIDSLKLNGVILWFMVELLLLTLIMYLIYGNVHARGLDLINEIITTFKYTLLITIIPYTGAILYLAATEKDEKNTSFPVLDHFLIKFVDENDVLHIAIDLDQILYLKSADNYVAIYYHQEEKVKKELVRTTMRKLDGELKDYPIKRCHRSYMVNLKRIAISEKAQPGLSLSLKHHPGVSIPVSKKYKSTFIRLLKKQENIQLTVFA